MRLKKAIEFLKPYVAGKPSDSKKTVKLNANECPYDLPRKIYRKASKIRNLNRYHEPSGFVLRKKLADSMGLTPESFILGNGSGELIQVYLQSFAEKDAEIIMSEATFTLYEMYGIINENKIIKIPLKKDFSMDLEQMASRVNHNTAAVFVCNPNNPTGHSYSYDELERFFKKIPENVGIFLDEAYIFYSKYNDDSRTVQLTQKYKNLFVLRTFSKIGLAGARIGLGFGNPFVIEVMHRVRPPFNINAYAVKLAEWILDSKRYLNKIWKNNEDQKKILIQGLRGLGLEVLDSDSNFILTKLSKTLEKELEKLKILIRNTQSFGLPSEYYRITIGRNAQTQALLRGLKEAVK